MELRLPLEMSPGREAACRAVLGTRGFFPNDARKNCPFVLTSFTGWSSERCPGIGFLSRGDREIGVLRNVEPLTRPRLECLRETGLILRCDRKTNEPPFMHGHGGDFITKGVGNGESWSTKDETPQVGMLHVVYARSPSRAPPAGWHGMC